MAVKKTPFVYVDEAPLFPSSGTEQGTLPAFLGFTELVPEDAVETPRAIRVESLADYEGIFGGPHISDSDVQVTVLDGTPGAVSFPELEFYLYHGLELYFKNGGGPCFVISVGVYERSSGRSGAESFRLGLQAIKNEPDINLILFPEAVGLASNDYFDLCRESLELCGSALNCFCIMDLQTGDDAVSEFRDGTGVNSLPYGAAYYPWLVTESSRLYLDERVSISDTTGGVSTDYKLSDLKSQRPSLYRRLVLRLERELLTLPAGPAVAGAYVSMDSSKGIWHTPANMALKNVLEPVQKIGNREQEDLNVDAISGKSINVIRSFTGRGTRIWGGRTLAGNDNEWRYISIRRLFIQMEKRLQELTAFAVFEPNNVMTWLKVVSVAEAYLDELWRAGAFAGDNKDDAYFTSIGLGKTMTEEDLLEGRLFLDVGVAPVTPAEFILLRFSHQLSEG